MEKNDMKPEISHVDNVYDENDPKDFDQTHEAPPQLKSGLDDLTTWQAIKTYKRVTVICMLAAFSASLDGYQGAKDHDLVKYCADTGLFLHCNIVNLNGGIGTFNL
jgi:hypothetical protein